MTKNFQVDAKENLSNKRSCSYKEKQILTQVKDMTFRYSKIVSNEMINTIFKLEFLFITKSNLLQQMKINNDSYWSEIDFTSFFYQIYTPYSTLIQSEKSVENQTLTHRKT